MCGSFGCSCSLRVCKLSSLTSGHTDLQFGILLQKIVHCLQVLQCSHVVAVFSRHPADKKFVTFIHERHTQVRQHCKRRPQTSARSVPQVKAAVCLSFKNNGTTVLRKSKAPEMARLTSIVMVPQTVFSGLGTETDNPRHKG